MKPSMEEMHPSKTHQSTTKEPDSGLRLGFTDIKAKAGDQPSGVKQQTPSKTGISSPTFDFRFARPGPQLGPEAQRMMDELREEALRIKAKLAAEREEEKRGAGESATGIEGRKIAQPKGKAGRFSNAHMAEFKKMDSIASHPSAHRAQPGRFQAATASLKRSQSKAKLEDREERNVMKSTDTERLENTAPAKRARQTLMDDTSSARPVSRGSHADKTIPSTPTLPRAQSSILASITTPTQSSLARAVKNAGPQTSQIPTLSRSPSKASLRSTPRGLTKSATTNSLSTFPKSEPRSFLRSPGRLDRVRSILRYPSSSIKPVSAASSAIASLPRSHTKPNLAKELPSVPMTPGLKRSKSFKHVNFTPDTIYKHIASIKNSPSPMKSGIPRSASKISLGIRSTASDIPSGVEHVQYPSIAGHASLRNQSQEVEYPSLAGVRPLPQPPCQEKPHPPASVPGTFTFRSDHTISFGASPEGFGSSPGQASVRQVRQSIFPNIMPGSFPGSNKENTEPLPAVPHGMSNKKRRRADSDDENEQKIERSPKKQKAAVAEGPMLMAPKIMAEKMAPLSRIPSPSKKKVLSMSRLNMLARPKMRK